MPSLCVQCKGLLDVHACITCIPMLDTKDPHDVHMSIHIKKYCQTFEHRTSIHICDHTEITVFFILSLFMGKKRHITKFEQRPQKRNKLQSIFNLMSSVYKCVEMVVGITTAVHAVKNRARQSRKSACNMNSSNSSSLTGNVQNILWRVFKHTATHAFFGFCFSEEKKYILYVFALYTKMHICFIYISLYILMNETKLHTALIFLFIPFFFLSYSISCDVFHSVESSKKRGFKFCYCCSSLKSKIKCMQIRFKFW